MRLAETVTFGGSGLNRAGPLRAHADAMARLATHSGARVLPVWRGTVLVSDAGGLGWVPPDHRAIAGAERLFLGLDDTGAPSFAADISPWRPDAADAAAAGFSDAADQRHPALPGARLADLRSVMAEVGARDAELAATARALLNWHASHGFCARCGVRSEMAQAGWLRRCPTCKAEHYPRTDPVVIMLVTRGDRLLMGRSAAWPPGMYSLLAGFVEPGETMEAAVRREVAEETGVRIGAVGYLASQPWPWPSSLMLGCHGEALSDEITVDPEEIEDALWLTREEMLDVIAGLNPAIRAGRPGAIAHFLIRAWAADALG